MSYDTAAALFLGLGCPLIGFAIPGSFLWWITHSFASSESYSGILNYFYEVPGESGKHEKLPQTIVRPAASVTILVVLSACVIVAISPALIAHTPVAGIVRYVLDDDSPNMQQAVRVPFYVYLLSVGITIEAIILVAAPILFWIVVIVIYIFQLIIFPFRTAYGFVSPHLKHLKPEPKPEPKPPPIPADYRTKASVDQAKQEYTKRCEMIDGMVTDGTLDKPEAEAMKDKAKQKMLRAIDGVMG